MLENVAANQNILSGRDSNFDVGQNITLYLKRHEVCGIPRNAAIECSNPDVVLGTSSSRAMVVSGSIEIEAPLSNLPRSETLAAVSGLRTWSVT